MTEELFNSYQIDTQWLDEAFEHNLIPRDHYQILLSELNSYSVKDIQDLNEYIRRLFFNQGITFNVYSDNNAGIERIFPFDLFPRIIPKKEWENIEKGLLQRATAINLFLDDIYHDKKILKDKIVPADLLFSCDYYIKFMLGFKPIGGIYTHVSGTDLVKNADGQYYILEDNLRCPSGVSYVLSNRDTMKKTLSHIFSKHRISSVQDYPDELLAIMQSVAPEGIDEPFCVVLTPGMYNSAYYEHSFLALSMGIPLVEGRDLYVDRNFVYTKTIYGPKRVDVIYRRIDDDFIDPLVFRPKSMLGIPGLMAAYREGNVNILNAPGTGAADDKAIYAYMPAIIKYYLGEEPILQNVPTYRADLVDDQKYILENLQNLVVKPVDQSGGYGIVVGNKTTAAEREELKKMIKAAPRKFIAQPIISLSVHPTYIDEDQSFEQRHIDLRTYTLLGKDRSYVLKGGLTRVALTKGSLIVNSSQGGGSKDTWVLN